MHKRLICVWMTILLAFGLVACQGGDEQPATTATTVWQASEPEIQELSDLLTREEVANATGQPVLDGVFQEQNTVFLFATEDYATQVFLLAEEPAISAVAYLDTLVSTYPEGSTVEAPNLGEKAYWHAESNELLVASGTHMVAVIVNSIHMDEEARLLAARSLAALAIERV